jgi:hypothetical protein
MNKGYHMKKFALAAALAVASILPARADLSPLLGVYNADNVTFYPGLLTYPNGPFQAMGRIYGTTATVATGTGTSEQILGTYSLPANALDAAGRRLRIHAVFSKAANTNATTAKLYFGSAVITTPSNTTSGAGSELELNVVKTASNTQIVTGRGSMGTAAVTPYSAAGAETDTAAIVIKATCTDGTSQAADCTLQDFWVEYLN